MNTGLKHQSRRAFLPVAAALVMVVALTWPAQKVRSAPPETAPAPAPAAAPAVDELADDPVEKAIQRAVAYLYSQQKGDNWENVPRAVGAGHADVNGMQWGGLSSMAVYGLLAAGENPQGRLAPAMKFLDAAPVIGVYAMGMKLQSWNYVRKPTAEQKKVLKKDAILLFGGCNTAGATKGLYHYPVTADGTYDISCSNYGVLGMWAAAQQNLEIPRAFWEMVDKAWREQQNKDGGWQYTGGGEKGAQAGMSTFPMTGAGVATLFITQDMLNANTGECKGNIVDDDIERGLAWLGKNTNVAQFGNLYAAYNVERVGTASGYKYFGTTDWFKTGADFLVKNQAADGSWSGGHGGPIPGTVWGLVFLVKGRAPVMMNKLEYAVDLHGDKGKLSWNERPRDVANLARHAGKQLEKDLNWQIVNLKVDIEDLHDAPILYVAGNQTITFTKEEKAKLKQYVEGGGMILGHADCNDPKFSGSFAKLGQELFPYEFRTLDANHLIYNAHYKRENWNGNVPTLRGMSNGARELMVLIPAGDPARYWQIQNFSGPQMKVMTEMVSNIYLYAADKLELKKKFKGQSYIVDRDEKVPAGKAVKVARLEYTGAWDPEPGGWRRLANVMHNSRGTDLTVTPVKLGEGKLTKEFQIAHLTGAFKFKLDEKQKAEIKAFVNDGGTLVVDAAGGTVDFKDSAEAALADMFPAGAKAPGATLPMSHPIYAAGAKIETVGYRAFAKRAMVGSTSTPRLRAIEVNNRAAVIYSAEDLSVGLVGMTMDGIYGYTPDAATKLMGNLITYAANGGGGATNVTAGAAGAAATPTPSPQVVPASATVPPAGKEMKEDDAPAKKPVAPKPAAAPAGKPQAKR